LFKIELALVWLIPDVALQARFWTIEDRFQRVVPKSVVQSYKNTLAAQSPGPVPNAVLRQRARNLLDTIHANYLINLAREQLIRRLMSILTAVAVLVMGVCTTIIATQGVPTLRAIVTVMLIGMAGAMISIIQRLQKATSRDAMVDDGIFELIGLRIGWVSVLLSVAIGGVFALFIYVLIAADILDQVLPQMSAGSAAGIGGSSPSGGSDGVRVESFWADQMYRALGLREQSDLFKLFVFAFASGFAERFVPDIIYKLTKEVLPGSQPTDGPPGGTSTAGSGQEIKFNWDSAPEPGEVTAKAEDATDNGKKPEPPKPDATSDGNTPRAPTQ
jgi:VanZ family protein